MERAYAGGQPNLDRRQLAIGPIITYVKIWPRTDPPRELISSGQSRGRALGVPAPVMV